MGSDPLRFHLFAAPWEEGNGGPLPPQSGHWTRNVPLNTIWGISPQNGQVFSTGMTSSVSISHSSVTDALAVALGRCSPQNDETPVKAPPGPLVTCHEFRPSSPERTRSPRRFRRRRIVKPLPPPRQNRWRGTARSRVRRQRAFNERRSARGNNTNRPKV
jgi:hypothetical protein